MTCPESDKRLFGTRYHFTEKNLKCRRNATSYKLNEGVYNLMLEMMS